MQWVNETFAPITDAIGEEQNVEVKVQLIISLLTEASLKWRGVRWQELYVLNWFCRLVTGGMGANLAVSILQQISKKTSAGMDLAVLGVVNLAELYELRLAVTPERSVLLHSTRAALVILISYCMRAGRRATREGFDSVKKMKRAAARLSSINSAVKSE